MPSEKKSSRVNISGEPRLGCVGDASECAGIISKWIDTTVWMPKRHSMEELTKMIEQGIPIREFWVLGDPIIGYLSFNRELSQIMGLYVAFPGGGAGKLLMGKVKEGKKFIQLWSHLANTSAHRFYYREGFNKMETNQNGQDGIPEIRFEWNISA